MCIHSQKDVDFYNKMLAGRDRPERLVSLRTSNGRLIGAWSAQYRNQQSVANTIRDLKSWHDTPPGSWVDLQYVNEARHEAGLEMLNSEGLPFPIGEALSQDMDVDLIMRSNRNNLTEFERGLKRYVEAQKKQIAELVPA